MKATTKLYLRTFLFFGLGYGLLLLLFDMYDESGLNWIKYLVLSIGFGAFMSLFTVSAHIYELKQNGFQARTAAELLPTQKRKITSYVSLQKLFSILKEDPIFSKMKMQFFEDKIELKSGITWKSFGENIEITGKKISDSENEFQIISRPKIKGTVIDYGKNLKNVHGIEQIFERFDKENNIIA